jgi:hypothetical protein
VACVAEERSAGDELAADDEVSEPRPPGFYTTMDPEWADLHYGFPYPPTDKERYVASDGGEWVFNNLFTGDWDAVSYPGSHPRLCLCGTCAPHLHAGIVGETEPPLTPDELVGVRGLLQERYSADTGDEPWAHDCIAHHEPEGSPGQKWRCSCGRTWEAESAGPLDIRWKDISDRYPRLLAEPAPSPTIVQSAPPPTVDGEGPASVRDIQPSPEAGRPTSELLLDAAHFLGAVPSSTAGAYGLREFIRELRDRAATFKAIEE